MASVYDRGSRRKANWWAKIQQRDGTWRPVPTKQPTRTLALRWAMEEEGRIARGEATEPAAPTPRFTEIADKWIETLTNRSASDDRSRFRKHVRPYFSAHRMDELATIVPLMKWIDVQRRPPAPRTGGPPPRQLAEPTIRHNLNLLSRFFGYAIERGYAMVNPVRLIPQGKRPQQSPKREAPWLNDDAVVRQLVNTLRAPVGVMFYVGNRSGLRVGEICGLRLSDLAFLAQGVIRVRYTYDGGPLKEDKRCEGKVKWAPAPEDAQAVLGPLLAERQAQGAQPEDFVFANPRRKGRSYGKEFVEAAWEEGAVAVGLFVEVGESDPETKQRKRRPSMTFYQATRHSFVSRNLARGASLDEVSAAVGHSSPIVTKRFYDHFLRKSFSPTLREGLGLGAVGGADITPIKRAR